MKTRLENIIIIEGLFGFVPSMLEDVVGYKGLSSENYTDEELNDYREYCEKLDDDLTEYIK